MADLIGPLNTLLLSLAVSAGSMLVLWPISNSVGPLIAFVIINGAANGGFFATMPTVVGNIFGSARVSIAMGMVVTGWAGGYLLVSVWYKSAGAQRSWTSGCSNRGLSPQCVWRTTRYTHGISSGHLLCRVHGIGGCDPNRWPQDEVQQESIEEALELTCGARAWIATMSETATWLQWRPGHLLAISEQRATGVLVDIASR